MRQLKSNSELRERHVRAVVNRLRKSFNESAVLTGIHMLGDFGIEEFLLADVDTMRKWVETSPQYLQFTAFRELYSRFFCKGSTVYVDESYNAYSFIREMEVSVCPYCDDEYIDIIDTDNHRLRTSEIDHFFPKGKYPALAMCFYNLVPCGKACNGIKLEHRLGRNPHESGIEELTYIYPDIPIGIALDKIDPDTCAPKFHPKDGMESNVEQLALEQRYLRHASEVHRLLRNLQLYSSEKIDELVKLGFGSKEQIISTMFGPQDPTEKKKALRQKMLRDITGY